MRSLEPLAAMGREERKGMSLLLIRGGKEGQGQRGLLLRGTELRGDRKEGEGNFPQSQGE